MKSYFEFLRHNKAYTLIDVLGLALSIMFIVIIGAYTWQETHIDTQHSKKDRIYMMGLDFGGNGSLGLHQKIIPRLMAQYPEIESGAAFAASNKALKSEVSDKVTAHLLYADTTFYSIFDFGLVRGSRDKVLSDPHSIVVSEKLARTLWPSDDPMGKTVTLYDQEGSTLTVTGIMEEMDNTAIIAEDGKELIDAIIPFPMVQYSNPSLCDDNMSNATGAQVVLLAKEGADLTAHEQQYNRTAKQFFWILQLPDDNIELKVVPFTDTYFSDYSPSTPMGHGDIKMVRILFAVGLVILLFALMNYVNLTVALSGYRAKEMATRRLLGDSAASIMVKLIGESTLLCVLSAVIGVFLAYLAMPYASILLDTTITLANVINPVTVGIFVAIILVMGILAGIIPAVVISSAKPIDVVRGTFRRQTKMVFSRVFIVVQNVVTITMIASAITMYLQALHLVNAPLGYDTENIMYVWNGGDKEKADVFIDKVSALPQVEMVSAVCGTPLDGGNNNTGVFEGRTVSFQILIGDENYLKIFSLGLEKDYNVATTPKIYLNKQALSELDMPEDAKNFNYAGINAPICGVLEDFQLRTVLDDPHPVRIEIRPRADIWPWGYVIKVNGDQAEAFNQIKKVYKDVFEIDYTESAYFKQQIEERFASQLNLAKMVSIFAFIAIVISLLGLVAMSTYYVQQRRHEIAVKRVFGCDTDEMLRKLVLQFMWYVVIAFVIAVPLIYYLMHTWLSDFSYRIDLYWWIYALSGAGCIVVSIISVFVQSYRAANENPIKSL